MNTITSSMYWAIWRLLCILIFLPLNTWTPPLVLNYSCSRFTLSRLPALISAHFLVLLLPCQFCFLKSQLALFPTLAFTVLLAAKLCFIRNVCGLMNQPSKWSRRRLRHNFSKFFWRLRVLRDPRLWSESFPWQALLSMVVGLDRFASWRLIWDEEEEWFCRHHQDRGRQFWRFYSWVRVIQGWTWTSWRSTCE